MSNFIVVINFFNAEETIKNTIKSIINQKLQPKEVYLFNNSSTDKSKDIVLKTIKNHKHFFYVEINQFLSLVKARNYAIRYIKKNTKLSNFYFSFCDSDDLWLSNWISLMSKYEKFSYDLLICNSKLKKGNRYEKISSGFDHFYMDSYFCPIYLNTVMINSKLIKNQNFFDEKFELLYDLDFWISNSNRLTYISTSDFLSIYVKHGNNLSSTKKFQIFYERLKIVKKHKLSLSKFFFKTILRFFK